MSSKQKNVIDEKATNSKLKQLQIDMAIGKRSIEGVFIKKKSIINNKCRRGQRRKINEALKADVLLRDRISKLNKKEYGSLQKHLARQTISSKRNVNAKK